MCSVDGKEFLAIMLADGATACEKGLEGARLACAAVSRIIEKEAKKFFSYPKEKIAYLLTEEILYWLECGRDSREDVREYGSTFMLALMEKKTGRTVLVNLGDGAALSINENGFSFLTRPRRFRGNPCLTTTEGAHKAIDIEVRSLALGNTVLLCSDGFLDQLGKGDTAAKLKQYDTAGLNRELQMTDNSDDCSYIAFTRGRK